MNSDRSVMNRGGGKMNWSRANYRGSRNLVNRSVHRPNIAGELLGLRGNQEKLMLNRLWGGWLLLQMQLRLNNRKQRCVFARKRELEESANC